MSDLRPSEARRFPQVAAFGVSWGWTHPRLQYAGEAPRGVSVRREFVHNVWYRRDRIRTAWTSKDIWLRQAFAVDTLDFDHAVLILHHDDDTEVRLNGEVIWQAARWNNTYQHFDVTNAVRGALRPGTNVVAVHTRQDAGGQYIDLALILGRAQTVD